MAVKNHGGPTSSWPHERKRMCDHGLHVVCEPQLVLYLHSAMGQPNGHRTSLSRGHQTKDEIVKLDASGHLRGIGQGSEVTCSGAVVQW